jgi:hypothetical protein
MKGQYMKIKLIKLNHKKVEKACKLDLIQDLKDIFLNYELILEDNIVFYDNSDMDYSNAMENLFLAINDFSSFCVFHNL